MRTAKPQLVRPQAEPMNNVALAQHARRVVAYHGERILAEVPTTLRRVGLFFLVLAITVPAFLAALIVVLWRLG